MWLSPACPPELAQAVTAAGGRQAAYLTTSCVAAVLDPADAGHPAHHRATELGIPVLDPERAWAELELTPPSEARAQPERVAETLDLAQTGRSVQSANATAVAASAAREPSHAPAAPAGWYQDPSGRWPWRWWDGDVWTPHVARPGAYTSELDTVW